MTDIEKPKEAGQIELEDQLSKNDLNDTEVGLKGDESARTNREVEVKESF